MNGFKVEAILTRVASTADKALSLGIHTKELDPIEKVGIIEFHNKAGWLLFSANPIEDTDIPSARAEIGAKTPAQRLRGVLFVLWSQSDKTDTFERFYEDKMEALIEKIKEKLKPEGM